MNEKNINIRSEKQRKQIKTKLMKKFNISSDKAGSILIKLENSENNVKQENLSPVDKKNNYSTNKNPNIKSYLQNTTHKEKKTEHYKKENNIANSEGNFNELTSEDFINSDSLNSQDVDSIISNIIPNYNYGISIELQNVSLTFEIVNDRIDTLKESIIRTLKRNKEKKIKFKVLDNISFKIYQGEKIGVIGYNGAGKSTLLKVITGIYPPDEGNVVTNGNISPLLSLGAGFDMNYSGRKNIYLNGAVLGYDKKFLEEKEAEIIEFSELEEFIDFPIKNYSSGMLAKLGFSIATIVNPDILIIDEILSVGDVSFHKKSADKIRSLMDGGTTVLLVSHSIPQIRETCDKAIWIDNGKVRAIGEVNKICDAYLKDSENASKKQLKNIQFK